MSGVSFVPAHEAHAAFALPPSQREPLVGHYVGDYLIIGRLGKGGFGKVLLALQRPLFRLKVAVKLIEFEAANERVGQKILDKFENEASALAILQSPNIVRLLQYGLFHGRPFMAMEYIQGSRTLQSEINHLIVTNGALDHATIRHVLEQILNGLEAAHGHEIIHRDIKPENIMLQDVVRDRWFVKIVDFGLAKVITDSRETSMVLGTVHYMAPEQVEAKDLGPWTDLYAVGAIAFELMVGQRPFPGRDSQEILRRKLDPRFDPLALEADLYIPDLVATFLRKALHRWPEERFRSTSELRDVLGCVFDSLTSTAHFTADLSRLVDSSDISDLRRKEDALADARCRLEEDQRRLTAEREALESDRLKLESERLNAPREVEYAAVGGTAVIHDSPGSIAPQETRLKSDSRFNAQPTVGLSTGLAKTANAPTAPRRSPRRAFAVALGVVLLAAGVAAAVLATDKSADGASDTVTAVTMPPHERPTDSGEPTAHVQPAAGPEVATVAATESAAATPPNPEEEAPDETADADAATSDSSAAEAEPEAAAEARLLITAEPRGARVAIDDEPPVATPLVYTTTVGARHRVVLSAAGRASEVHEVEVDNVITELDVTLARSTPASKRPPAASDPASASSGAKPNVPAPKPEPPTLMDF